MGTLVKMPNPVEEERRIVLESITESEQKETGDSKKSAKIAERENDYQSRRLTRKLSPSRTDPFAEDSEKSVDSTSTTYIQAMKQQQIDKERHEVMRKIREKERESRENEDLKIYDGHEKDRLLEASVRSTTSSVEGRKRTRRWDMPTPDISAASSDEGSVRGFKGNRSYESEAETSEWEEDSGSKIQRSRWDETPKGVEAGSATPIRTRRSRWDSTPANISAGVMTPLHPSSVEFPTPSVTVPMTPEHSAAIRWELELDARNRPWTDEELDAILPSEGYSIVEPPANYIPIQTPSRKLTSTPTPLTMSGGFQILPDDVLKARSAIGIPLSQASDDLPFSKPEDYQYFAKLLDQSRSEDDLTIEEAKERKIMKLLLRIKNGTPQMRRVALKQLTDKAREFGPGPLFDQILPLLMSPALEDQERHLLVKVIDRLLFKLDDLVRPYVHKILVVIEPLLIDEDYYARLEGREIIANLSKAAGLATMIATMRPDIDHVDEYVRNTTARAFSVVASALGIPALLPFLKAVCKSKKSWQARHTGIKIIQQIALLMGVAVIPHLRSLVECVEEGLNDEQVKVRTITALALAALAEASSPYGIESFESVLKSLWKGIRQHRGKGLAAFLKAVGQLIPLMDVEYANYYSKEVMPTLIREFQTPDDDMKKIVLKVVKQCASTDGVQSSFLKSDLLPEFFRYFWVRRMSLDRRNIRQLLETTVELTGRVGVGEVVGRLVDFLKDESEVFRRVAIEAIEQIISKYGSADVGERMEEQLVDGLVFCFQEQVTDDSAQGLLRGFGNICINLGKRMKPYLTQISSMILWRLGNRSAKIRQLAADLIAALAPVYQRCEEEATLAKLSVVLYENLGEEYPDVLGSILSGIKAIVSVIGMGNMTPPISELLPRLNPILRNRHEKVQENCIQLVGKIADRSADSVSAREWMRICFELLDMLKAQRKSIRMEAVRTFGYIAKAIGPHDVLATLLNNLRVQERQNRVCTTVAIAIISETCAPFTVLPALMNEYRVPELNVQNGVLKSLAFMFEYIGDMSKDYVYSVTTLLEDALTDRDQVHRQIASNVVKNLALGVYGFGCEDALLHMLNLVFPNIFETSQHVINAVMEAVDAIRFSAGPGAVLLYLIQGLFHPARKVRSIYWKVYNNLYIGGQESIVPFYPEVNDEDGFVYYRHVLDVLI